MNPILLSLASTLFGVLLRYAFDKVREGFRFKKELKDNNFINVSAQDWHVAWQTSVEQRQVINTERLHMKQKGNVVHIANFERSPENPKGGYLWDAQMQFFQGRYLMGWYFALKSEHNASKGIMFFCYHSPKRVFYGKWVGTGYDGDLASGFGVISKDRSTSLSELEMLIKRHDDGVNIISHMF